MKDKPDNLSPHSEKFDKREVREIPLDCIITNRYQPRSTVTPTRPFTPLNI
ncbi:MAG: hypothetical protein HZA49_04505 [Planctomycetes bacterium]|nr:hypothetical protein [Planctomycetota bacterium]